MTHNVHDRCVPIGPLTLASGVVLPEVSVAFAHYGTLAPDGRNAILVAHGYTASHRLLAHGDGVAEGSWASLIGPGRPLDTDRFFIVSSNMLGSCYGTTGPASIDPRSGTPYGSAFPDITLADIVEVQRRLLERLGVRHLRAVVGPSFGGMVAQQWALDHPGFVDAIGVVLSAPCLPRNEHTSLSALKARLDRGMGSPQALHAALVDLRLETLATYGGNAVLAAAGLDADARQARARAQAETWAREFDAQALIVLLKAGLAFDARPRLPALRADVLYVICDTDLIFPPHAEWRQALSQTLARRPLHYVELRSDFGHMASGAASAGWRDALASLLTLSGAL